VEANLGGPHNEQHLFHQHSLHSTMPPDIHQDNGLLHPAKHQGQSQKHFYHSTILTHFQTKGLKLPNCHICRQQLPLEGTSQVQSTSSAFQVLLQNPFHIGQLFLPSLFTHHDDAHVFQQWEA
jgi:hypothetical protein